MAEQGYQTEEETVTSEFTEEVTTDATDNDMQEENATIEADDVSKMQGRASLKRSVKKRRDRERNGERSMNSHKATHTYMESRKKLEKEDVPRWKMSSDISRLSCVEHTEKIFPPYECFPLGGFRLEHRAEASIGLDRCKRTRIWKNLRTRRSTHVCQRGRRISRTESAKWPNVWPCTTRDLANELRTRKGERKRKRRDIFPCDPEDDDKDNEFFLNEQRSDFANRKELGHVRVPVACPEPKPETLDRAAGERPGLVNGDYVISELGFAGQNKRVYANVVLRGLKGMHLPELSALRERRDTWKFCFYQAVVALLAKTQLRYKYVWSTNIDYIYDHAWTLYTHIGTINVKKKQRLDDVVVYNYKYSIELDLVQEMKKVPVVREVDFDYEESSLRRQMVLERKDPLEVRVEIGCEKVTEPGHISVHENVKEIEEWFDELPVRYRNCIFRTPRFSLAFWQDGLFWYLYNPYRCNEFGLWDDDGRGCIVKFCSKDSLRRHLMILLLRAYAYQIPKSGDPSQIGENERDKFNIQIFHVIFRCCQLHNLKLLQRKARKSPRRVDESLSDCFDTVDRDTADQEEADDDDYDLKDLRERPTWLKRFRVTWSRCACANRKRRSGKAAIRNIKERWHQYYVEEFNRLFSLWGEVHITDDIFDEANRGMQTYACYVVCAGMTRLIAPEYWSSKILDVIVICGDSYYTRSKLEAESKSTESEYAHVSCWIKYLASRFRIGETFFEARMLRATYGRLYAKSDESLWKSLERMFLEYHFGILTCESACLGLFKFCGAYYVCDVNSFGPPLFQYGHGATYLMRATSFHKFMTVLVLTVCTSECSQFSLNPIEILKVVEMGPSCESDAKTIERSDRLGKFTKGTRTLSEPKKSGIKNRKRREVETIARTIRKTCCKDKK